MAGEFLGQDYLNAAVDFGTSLGGGVLSTLSNTANAAGGVVSQGVGYLTSLTQDQQAQEEKEKNDIKPTKINAQTTSPASRTSSSLLNFDNLTNGSVNTFKSPDIMKTMGGIGNSVMNNLKIGASGSILPTVVNLPSLGAQTSFNIASNSGLIAPTVQNPSSRVSSIPGTVNNAIDNTNNNPPIYNPNLPFISDASKIITPYASTALESLDITSKPLTGGTNFMIFDKEGNIISYAGSGTQQLFGDIENIISAKEKEAEEAVKSGQILEDMGSAADIAKSVLWDAPYTLGGNTGNIMVNAGKVTRDQLEKVIDAAPNMTVAKVNMQDGTTILRWKPQENPTQAKNYPKEKEASLFDKGDSYITEGIPNNLKYQQKYKVTKGVSTDDSGSDTATYIPGVSNMLIKGLRHVEVPKEGESEADKDERIGNDNIFDPTKLSSSIAQSNKLNNMASKYAYTQTGNSGYGYGNPKDKEKKKNVYRKKAVASMPKIILVNALRRQINQITNRVNNKHIPLSIKRKHIIKEKLKKIEPQFIQRKPDVKFKVITAMKGVSDISGNIESIISLNRSSSNTSLNHSQNKIIESPQFNFNLENILVKPKQTLKKGKNLINIKI